MTGLPHTRGGSSSGGGEELPPGRRAAVEEPPGAALGPATEAGGRGLAGEGPFSRPTGSTAEDPPSGQQQQQAAPLASSRGSGSGGLDQAGGKAQPVVAVEPPLFSWGAQLQAPAGSELVVLGGLLAVVPIVLSLLSRALALVVALVLSVAISGAFPALTDWLVAMGLPVARSIVGTATVQQDSNGSGPSSSQALLLGSSSSTNGLSASSSSWQVQAPVLTPIDPSRRDFSLHGARADMSEFRVVDGEYASHKVALSCKGQDWAVWRRYSEFEDLREALLHAARRPSHGGEADGRARAGSRAALSPPPLPTLPPKTIFRSLNAKFLTHRTEQLLAFLREVLKRRDLCDDPALRAFLEASPLAPSYATTTAPSSSLDGALPVATATTPSDVAAGPALPLTRRSSSISGSSSSAGLPPLMTVAVRPEERRRPSMSSSSISSPPSSLPSPPNLTSTLSRPASAAAQSAPLVIVKPSFLVPSHATASSSSLSPPLSPARPSAATTPPITPRHEAVMGPATTTTAPGAGARGGGAGAEQQQQQQQQQQQRPTVLLSSSSKLTQQGSDTPDTASTASTSHDASPALSAGQDSRPSLAQEGTATAGGGGLLGAFSRLFTSSPSMPLEEQDTPSPPPSDQQQAAPPPPGGAEQAPVPAVVEAEALDREKEEKEVQGKAAAGEVEQQEVAVGPRPATATDDCGCCPSGGQACLGERAMIAAHQEHGEGAAAGPPLACSPAAPPSVEGGGGGERRGASKKRARSLSELAAQHGLAGQPGAVYYDPGPTNRFHVRGKTYLHDNKKIAAGPAVGKLVFGGVFKAETPQQREDHVASRGRVRAIVSELAGLEDERPFLFVLNFQVPGDPPLSLVFIFALPPLDPSKRDPFNLMFNQYVAFGGEGGGTAAGGPTFSTDSARGSDSTSVTGSRSAASSVSSDDGEEGEAEGVYSLSDFKNKRFKLIPSIVEGPSVVRWAVGAKPAILGQKLTQRYFRGPSYVETDVDVASSVIASQVVSLCRGYAKHLTVELGIVLEGKCEDELPEKLIGCIGINKLDLNQEHVDNDDPPPL